MTGEHQKSLRDSLERFINHPRTDIVVIVLISLSVTLTILEFARHTALLELVNDLITCVFIVELSIRYFVARSKKRFFSKYWIDIIAVLPWARSLRVLRVLRLLRLFRMGIIVNRKVSNVSAIFRGNLVEYFLILLVLITAIIIGALGIKVSEGGNPSFSTLEQSLWWSVMSIVAGEPIGGEPTTRAGRLFTLLTMLSGLTIFAIFTGTVSAVMVKRLRNLDIKDMDIEELRGHTVICGYNASLPKILNELTLNSEIAKLGIVLISELDSPPPLPDTIKRDCLYFVQGDYTQMDTLKKCGIPHAKVAILLADRSKDRSDQDCDARTVLAAITIERINPDIFTSVELKNRDNGTFLSLMGVEEIVVAEEYAGHLLAMATLHRGLIPMVDELLSHHKGNAFLKLDAPPSLQNKTIRDASRLLRETYNCTLIGVEVPKHDNNTNTNSPPQVILNPPIDLTIIPGTVLVIIATELPKIS